jgi:glucoamylase
MEDMLGTGAFGWPGIEPRWTHSNKSGVGTAYSSSSQIWFTLWNGIVTEVYHPTIDRPQLRDLQFLISDGKTFMHEEKRDMTISTKRLAAHTLGYRCVNADTKGRYTVTKDIICAPHSACLLIHTTLRTRDAALSKRLKMYVLCAPHLEMSGYRNSGYVAAPNGLKILMAKKEGRWLALGATVPFSKVSCGYVGVSDGWTDLKKNFRMDWEFAHADDGNIALTGELDLAKTHTFTLGLAFGNSEHRAVSNLLQALGIPFHQHLEKYHHQWEMASSHLKPLGAYSCDGGNLYCSSFGLLHAHEDKSFAGALIASLAIPWGEAKTDADQGGYHLVWTRDMVNSATALLATGDTETPLRALIYLAVAQGKEGGFAQNFWVNGEPYMRGIQLDEAAFPMILAWRLHCADALAGFDPINLVRKGASFLIRHGPVTGQDRWEEAPGYSPSTLASNIAALICAAVLLRAHGDRECASFIEDYADYLEEHLEAWTVTTIGTLVPDRPIHYMRLLPEEIGQGCPAEGKDHRIIHIANLKPHQRSNFKASEVVDGGFLELVRYGIRDANDPTIRESVAVIDAILKVQTPSGPTWHRYNHDGYGQQDNGDGFTSHGKGRVWPLLTGERGHYELAAGRSTKPYLRAMEKLASDTGLLPEQSWDEEDAPDIYMYKGRPTGSAMPLMWAHAEYVKLLRSTADNAVFDRIPEVADRYIARSARIKQMEVWKPTRKVRQMRPGEMLRIQADAQFVLHWSADRSVTTTQAVSRSNSLSIEYVDLDTIDPVPGVVIQFTFFWVEKKQWEGQDYVVTVVDDENRPAAA